MNKTERIEQNNYYALLLRKRYMQLLSFTEYFPEDSTSYVEVPVETLREVMVTLSAVRSHVDKLTSEIRKSS